MLAHETNAAAAGRWTLGDLTVNRIGFGTKRLTGRVDFDLGMLLTVIRSSACCVARSSLA